jgi:hypothetical protein
MAVRSANIMAARGSSSLFRILKLRAETFSSCCGCYSNLTRPQRYGQDDTIRKRRDYYHE